MIAEISKLHAEARKITQETKMAPLIAAATLVGAMGVALGAVLGAVVTLLVKH